MKVFVYDKKTSKTIATFRDVICVHEFAETKHITIEMSDTSVLFSTKEVKTRIYQN